MAAWRDGITITTEVAFVSDPLATAPTYTDISADVRGIRIGHGTTSEDGETSTPSSCTIQLSNRTRKYDPDHATGPYYGYLMPRKRIRVTAALGAFSAVIFTGWVNGWPQQFDRRFDATVPVTATSSFTMLNSSTLPTSAYAQEVLDDTPIAYYPLQGSLTPLEGYGTATFALEPTTNPANAISYLSTQTAPIGETEMATMATGAGAIVATDTTLTTLPSGIEAWVYTTSTNSIYVGATIASTTFIRFGVTSGGDLITWYSHASDNLTNIGGNAQVITNIGVGLHHVVMSRSGTTLTYTVDGSQSWTTSLIAGTNSTSFTGQGYWLFWNTPGATGGVSHFATYNSVPSATRLATHYNVGKYAWTGSHGDYGWERGGARIGRILDDVSWPSNLRDIDNGVTLCGQYLPAAGNPISAMQDVARAEAGVLANDTSGRISFVDRQALWTATAAATFSDDGAGGAVKFRDPVVDGNSVALIRNVASSTYGTAGTEVTKTDTSSRTSYGASKQVDSTPTLVDITDASNRSSYIVRNKKTPTTRITRIVVPVRPCSPGTTTTITTQITGACRQIGDIVNVEVTPMGVGAQTVKRCVVYGVTHDISDTEWITNMYLSAPPTAATSAPYLVCPSTGTVGAANGRLIPY